MKKDNDVGAYLNQLSEELRVLEVRLNDVCTALHILTYMCASRDTGVE